MPVPGRSLTDLDRDLIRAAQEALRRGFDRERHGVAAAVRTRTGAVYLGVNLGGIHTPCAEPVALGAAMTAGDRDIASMVAVCRRGSAYPVLSPCGNCRQMLFDYAPRATVIVRFPRGRLARLTASESLPGAFSTFGEG
jgi:cytidine deaminase